MNKSLAVLGASGHGKVVADLAESLGYKVTFFDDVFPEKKLLEHWKIEGNTECLINNKATFPKVVIAIGNNAIRKEKYKLLEAEGFEFSVLIHPKAIVSQYADVGDGTVVFAGAVINAFAKVARGCIINTSSVVEHDCLIGAFSHVCPNSVLAGSCELGELSWFGAGSSSKQLVKVGSSSIVGAGSVVVNDIPSGVTALGSPAKVVKVHKC